MTQLDDDVLQRVGSGPVALRVTERRIGVDEVDERGDRRGARGVVNDGGREPIEGDGRGSGGHDRFDVGGIVAAGATDERVLADVHRRQELLGGGTAHRPRHRGHDHVGEPEPVEQRDVGSPVRVVGRLEAVVAEIEAVRVLHHELAVRATVRRGAGLVAVLGLDLVDRQRQVLVGAADVLDEEREHLLVGRRQQEVGALAILQAEEVVAVLGPAAARFVRFAGQQRREMDLLESGGVHLLTDDPLDVAIDEPAERQPRETTGGRSTDVAGSHEQAMARYLGIGRIVS